MSAAPLATGSRERILDAGLELIARYGIAGMSLQLLADHVGLHKSTLFHHFSDKRELIDAVTDRFMAEVTRRVEPLERDDPPRLETFVSVAEELDEWFAERPNLALFVVRDILGPFEPGWTGEQSAETTRFFGILTSWLDRARQAGAVRRLSVPQAIVNLMGLAIFYPALVDHFGDVFAVRDARGPEMRRRRRRELRETLERALAP
ncbi:MAG: TetR/AcrR family transcriptional regulator [Proteobacteria bacterium]|nr:TetR/AcrR family transcriptional regulator [Pseudomonadota bacterium]